MERLLPQAVEAEQTVLASILIDPESYASIAEVLVPEDFYRDAHRTIYEAMQALAGRRIGIDYLTLSDELHRRGRFEDVGGFDMIDTLVRALPAGNVEHHAALVARTAQHRRLIAAAAQIATYGYSQRDDAAEQAEKLLFSLQRGSAKNAFHAMPELITGYMEEQAYLHEHRGAIIGCPTGYDDLDATLNGLQRSDLVLLAARPGMGKTSLALCMAYNAALRGKQVAVFSLEMSQRLLTRRLMSMRSNVDLQRLRSGWIDDDEWEGIERAASDLSALPIFINDTSGNPVASMRSQLRRLIAERGPMDLVVVDYLGLIEPDSDRAQQANMVQQISMISRGLKGLARECDVPVLALCQLNRSVEARQNKRPMLSDLRDSGSLEQDADVVLFIYREDYYGKIADPKQFVPTHQAEIIIEKHRNGPTGTVLLHFQAEQTMFYDLEKRLVDNR